MLSVYAHAAAGAGGTSWAKGIEHAWVPCSLACLVPLDQVGPTRSSLCFLTLTLTLTLSLTLTLTLDLTLTLALAQQQ